ncbi:hypothetical protein [Duncaniella muris]|nr:hypothetical protein [Duncaniella muris]
MKVLKILMAILFGIAAGLIAVMTFSLFLFGLGAKLIVGIAHKIK